MTIPGSGTLPVIEAQAGSIKQIIEASGSDELRALMSEKKLNDADLVQYALSNPKELGMIPRRDDIAVANSDGDPDLLPFDDDEVKGGGGIFGALSFADKAKPDMQQNLREARLIMKSLEEMKKENRENGDEIDTTITSAIGQIRDKEETIKKCLARGRGAADDAYRSAGVDPKDKSAVSRFVDDIGRDVLKIGTRQGLDVMVSDIRAGRLFTKKSDEDEDS